VTAGGLDLSEIPYGGIHTMLGALPILLHPSPRRVAVIGLGSGDTSYAAGARSDVEEVVTVEIAGSQLDALRAFHAQRPYPGLATLFEHPRFRIVVGDGRTHVRRDPGRFDVIEADALRPTSAYAGNLYSLEYFALLRERLAPGGLAVTWVPTPRVFRTFVRSFPHVLRLGDIAVGSDTPIPFDRAALFARCREPDVQSHFRRVGIEICELLRRALAAEQLLQIGPDDDRSHLSDVNSDLFAKDEFLVRSRP
jgi:hypothetical protein